MTVPGVYSPSQGKQKRDPIIDWGNRILGCAAILGVALSFLNVGLRSDMHWSEWFGFAVLLYVAVTSIWSKWVKP